MATDSSVQDLNKLLEQAKGARSRLEPDWYLNVAFYQGDQWVFWNHGRIDRPQIEDWRITLVDNRILPVAFSRVSKKVKNRPTFVVTPNSLDEADLNASEIASAVLEDDWIALNLGSKLFEALLWAEVCGAGFWKVYWDKTLGESEEYVVNPDGQVFQNPQDQRPLRANDPVAELALQQEGFSTQQVAKGNVRVEVLSPFNIYPDPLAEDIDECEFIIEEHIRSVDYVKRVYGKDIQPDSDVPTGITESKMFPFISESGGTGNYKGVTLYEIYSKKNDRRAVWTKHEKLLETTLEEAPFEGCPYLMFSGISIPGRFWPTCVTSQLRGPNAELNKIESQIRENALRIGNPSLTVSRQANVQYTGLPGEVVYYDSTVSDALPGYLQPPEMPQYVQSQVDRIENTITEISGMHEVSKATVPSGVTAASAINLLQEADDTRLGPEIQDMERTLGKAGTKDIKLRARYQDDQRTIQSAGEDGEWDMNEYRGAVLKPVSNVEVQAGSAMPRSQAAKQAAMQEIFSLALQYGLDVKPRDIRKFLRDYGVGGLENLFASVSTDEVQIRRENNMMKNGQAIDINDFDDDELHIEGHNEHRKTKTYAQSPDEVKQIFTLHVRSHMERKQKAIDAQVQAMQANANGNANPQSVPR